MQLIITEKPSVAKDIARVLNISTRKEGFFENKTHCVTWAYGHLIELVMPEGYDDAFQKWNFNDLPIIPDSFLTQPVSQPSSQAQLRTIQSLLNSNSIKEVICATDAGREGELIFRYIYQSVQSEKPIKRLWISSQTDEAIKEGFDNLKPGQEFEALFDSSISRSEADWLVGINATRAYTIRFSRGKGVMSVGRVQTPVLKLIVDRYREHTQFIPETFYEIDVDSVHENGSYLGKWNDSKKSTRLSDKKKAQALLQHINDHPKGTLLDVSQKEKREKPPLLYDLTELQKDANKLHKFSADYTLKVMQNLYEKHKLLTYPRTSSRYLSKDIVPKLSGLLKNLTKHEAYSSMVDPILAQSKVPTSKRIVDDTKVTDHHAIIPTNKSANLALLSKDESKIFDMVIRRFIAVFYEDCVKGQTEISTRYGDESIKTMGVMIKHPGWRAVYSNDGSETHSKKKKEDPMLPSVKKGDPVSLKKVSLHTGKTKPPPLYSEATLLGAMETAGKQIDDDEMRQAMKDCGLGTPATRAQIIERLITVQYIVRDGNRFIPTEKGKLLIENIQDDALLSPELTGEWEKKLNQMAQNKFSRSDYMDAIKVFAHQLVENVESVAPAPAYLTKDPIGICPLCDGNVVAFQKAFSCVNWKDKGCKFAIWRQIAGKEVTEKMAKTLLNDGKTKVIKGFKSKAGKSFEAGLQLEDGKVGFWFSDEPPKTSSFGNCPACKAPIIETPKAFSCSGWRTTGCKFAIWKSIAKKTISAKIAKQLLKKGETDVIKGFTSKAGKSFEAALTLRDSGVGFKF